MQLSEGDYAMEEYISHTVKGFQDPSSISLYWFILSVFLFSF
jgi:hypothetical protein